MCTCNTNCDQSQILTPCQGCVSTLNTDCVVYDDTLLSWEDAGTEANSVRYLTSLLKKLSDKFPKDKPSKLIENNYTLLAEDSNKILMLRHVFEDSVSGNVVYTITLPISAAFCDKIFTFKDITLLGATTVNWAFNLQIKRTYRPTITTTNLFSDLDDGNGVLRLGFLKTDALNYEWVAI